MNKDIKGKNTIVDFGNDKISVSECSLENQYLYIVDATNIVSKTDLFGTITYANSKFAEISGYSKEELIGQQHNILRHPDMKASLFKELWKTIRSKQVWNGVISNMSKDGSKYTVEASIFPILDENGEIAEYIAIRHDITQLQELNNKINTLHNYDIQQQNIAREKLEKGIVNNFNNNECKVLYSPSDIISGDFYSLYKAADGSRFFYIIDGQGHGISPALTVFAVSSTINQLINRIGTFKELSEHLFPAIKTFLGDEEQLSYTMMMITPDSKKLCYISGGMYPFLLKTKDAEIIKVKTNNMPFMNFSKLPFVNEVNIENCESILLYSDGLIEHEDKELSIFSPQNLIREPSLIESAKSITETMKLEDDVTLLFLKV